MTGFFQRLLGRRNTSVQADSNSAASASDTTGIPSAAQRESSAGAAPLVEVPVQPPQLCAGCAQSIGRQRDHNEDALFTLTTTLASNGSNLPFGLYIVADGMGGHQYGEIASNTAVRVMAGHVVRRLYTPLLGPRLAAPEESIQEIMQAGVQEAHRAILGDAPGGGTTLTAVLLMGEQMTIAHVGDSRAYSLSTSGELKSLTRDHSLVRRLEELGQITAEEASIHPQRNVLYRALGQGEPFDPDVTSSPRPDDGYLLVCSDGLWGVVTENALVETVLSSPNPQSACQRLVDAANAAGGPDNITAILVRMPSG